MTPFPAAFLARELCGWFAAHARPLPWRDGYAPYHVWLSEVMLQQTQMDRAVAYFRRFLARCPDIAALAVLPEDELLKLWEGLGYYSRARNLRLAAQWVVQRHAGRLPDTPEELLELPGVGPYTAAAVAAIAFNAPAAAVDANVERVLARLLDYDQPVKAAAGRNFVKHHAQALVEAGRPREVVQGLMELGALVCRPRQPRCSACPWATRCLAHARDTILERPLPRKPPQVIDLAMACGVLVHEGRILVQRRPPTGVWAGLWEFPGGTLEAGETPAQCVVREFREETDLDVTALRPLAVVRHGYTRYRVALHAFSCRPAGADPRPALHAATENRWATLAQLAGLAFPAGHRKLLELLHHLEGS